MRYLTYMPCFLDRTRPDNWSGRFAGPAHVDMPMNSDDMFSIVFRTMLASMLLTERPWVHALPFGSRLNGVGEGDCNFWISRGAG